MKCEWCDDQTRTWANLRRSSIMSNPSDRLLSVYQHHSSSSSSAGPNSCLVHGSSSSHRGSSRPASKAKAGGSSNKEYSTSSSSTTGRRRNDEDDDDDDVDDAGHRDPLDVDLDSMDEEDGDDGDETCAADDRYAPHPRLLTRPQSGNYYAVAGTSSTILLIILSIYLTTTVSNIML